MPPRGRRRDRRRLQTRSRHAARDLTPSPSPIGEGAGASDARHLLPSMSAILGKRDDFRVEEVMNCHQPSRKRWQGRGSVGRGRVELLCVSAPKRVVPTWCQTPPNNSRRQATMTTHGAEPSEFSPGSSSSVPLVGLTTELLIQRVPIPSRGGPFEKPGVFRFGSDASSEYGIGGLAFVLRTTARTIPSPQGVSR